MAEKNGNVKWWQFIAIVAGLLSCLCGYIWQVNNLRASEDALIKKEISEEVSVHEKRISFLEGAVLSRLDRLENKLDRHMELK